MDNKVNFIEGGISIDDRGQLLFINDFSFDKIKRFYMVENHSSGFIRAWHGHKKESKYIFVASGAVLIATVKINNWDKPDKNSIIQKFVLSHNQPGVLSIPAGFAHGFKTLTHDSKLIIFSSFSLDESLEDDYRYDAFYWNPWEILPR